MIFLIFQMGTILPLLGILIYGFRENQASALANLETQMTHNMKAAVHASAEMIDTVGHTISTVGASVAIDPINFKTGRGTDVIWRGLTSADQIDALYVSLEDGFHRVVTRVDEDRRKSDPQIPPSANWHSSYIDDFSTGDSRSRHRQFFEEWGGEIIANYSAPTKLDIRKLPHYIQAKSSRKLAVGEVSINPDTGFQVISLGFPVIKEDTFIGFVGANITLSNISKYLRDNRVSPNSVTIVYDNDRNLIASSDLSLIRGAALTKHGAALLDIPDQRIQKALKHNHKAFLQSFVLDMEDGEKISIMEMKFPSRFGNNWRVLSIAPTDDFVGDLIQTNREIAIITAILILTLSLVIFISSIQIRKTVNQMALEFSEIGQFKLSESIRLNSIVREIDLIEQSKEKMKLSLKSFGRYVPTDVVRQLLVSGEEAKLGGERRKMTIFFSDIANFTTISEKMSPEKIVDELGDYFTLMRSSLAINRGVVDKYIGDGILAIFNAPVKIPEHEIAGCLSAINAQRMLRDDRLQREKEQRPIFHTRIGLDVGEVLVGNIGTADRFSYTVIGDPVNLASRLEGLCKFYGVEIVCSGELRENTGDRFEWRYLDNVSVAGRTGSTQVHELLGEKGQVDPDILSQRNSYEEAIACYMNGSFDDSARLFASLVAHKPNNLAAKIMARRARKLNRSPPEGPWLGIYSHTKK